MGLQGGCQQVSQALNFQGVIQETQDPAKDQMTQRAQPKPAQAGLKPGHYHNEEIE